MNDSGQASARTLADHLFRHESGKMVSVLTGIYGAHKLQLAEDVVQDALVRALKVWPYSGTPENPAAWLMRTAKNLAIDQLRRETNFRSKQPAILAEVQTRQLPAPVEFDDAATAIGDDQLRLMFICCHPSLPAESQSALALKTLCGFSPAEIASAFLISEAAVQKRLTRARRKLGEQQVSFEIPDSDELPERLDSVLEILYLLFNEGYKSSAGDEIVRSEICAEAIRLGMILVAHPVGDRPRTHALLALMCLIAARLDSRTDEDGIPLRLEDQDRSLWDAPLIQTGMHHLARSAQGGQMSDYHLQAGIAACHTTAPADSDTDWPRILAYYDQLLQSKPSPIVALNRAVAISKVHGAARAIDELQSSAVCEQLDGYYLLHAVLGELRLKLGEKPVAAGHFRRAQALAGTAPERRLMERRLDGCH